MLNYNTSKIDHFQTAPLVETAVVDDSFGLERAAMADGSMGVKVADALTNAANFVGFAHVPVMAKRFRAIVAEAQVVKGNEINLDRLPKDGKVKVVTAEDGSVVDKAKVTVEGLKVKFEADLIADDKTVLVDYRTEMTVLEVRDEGLPIDFANQITGDDGAVEFATGNCQLETDLFDIEAEYNIGDKVYMKAGVPTTVESGEAIGTVAKVPSSDQSTLGVSGIWVW